MGFDFKAKILSLLKRPILDYVMPFVRWEPNFNTLKGAAPFSPTANFPELSRYPSLFYPKIR